MGSVANCELSLCRSGPSAILSLYVFEGSGSFRSASQPFGVLTEKEIEGSEALVRERTGNRSLVLFDSGDEVTVQLSEEGNPASAGLWSES